MLIAWRAAFLGPLATTGSVSKASALAGVSRETVYYHRQRNRRFKRDWDAALRQHAESRQRRAVAAAA